MKKARENVLVLTYWSFKDALIQTYTLPYVRMIKRNLSSKGKIFLVTLEQKHFALGMDEKKRTIKELGDEGIVWIPFKYEHFGLGATIRFLWMIIRLWWMIGEQRINTIHSWCMPAGGLGWILSKMTKKDLILDSYEPHAEPMVEAGAWASDSLAFRILFWLEKKQSNHATAAIACVSKMKDYALEKYNAHFDSFFVKPAGVDFELFHPRKRKDAELVEKYGLKDKIVYTYAGKFGGSYLSDEIFELLKVAQDFHKDRFAVVLLNAHSVDFITQKCMDHKIELANMVHKYVPHSEVPKYMGLGDVGLVPFVPVPSKRYGSPIKTAEYLSLGIPLIITDNISDDSEFVQKRNIGIVLKSLESSSLESAVSCMDEMLKETDLGDRCRSEIKKYRSFQQAELIYKEVYSE